MPGLDDFDEDEAAERLAAVGQQEPAAPAPVEAMPAPAPAVAAAPAAPAMAPAAAAPEPTPGGLEGFDSETAARHLADVGRGPQQNPAATPAAAAMPQPGTQEAVAGAAAGARQAREQADQAAVAAAEGDGGAVHARAAAADQRAAAHEDYQRQLVDLQKQHDAAEAQAVRQVQQTQDAIKGFRFHDYWATKSTGARVLSALAAAMGAFGSAITKTPNYALQIINDAMARDHQEQIGNLKQLTDQELMARTGLADARTARSRAVSDLGLLDAAKDRMIAGQLDQAVARSADSNYQQQVGAFAAKLRADAAAKEQAAQQQLFNNNLLAAREDDQRLVANARMTAAQARGHHAGGGGGGRGGALAAFTAAAIDGSTPEPQLAEMGLRAGLKPNQVAAEIVRIRKEHVGSSAGGADVKEIDKRAQAVRDKELIGTQRNAGPLSLLNRMEGMSAELQHAVERGDKAAAILALDEGSRMISGSAPTKTSTHLLQGLQSARDELESKWGHLTGDPGATREFTARLKGLVDSAAEEKRHQIDQIRERYIEQELGQHGFSRADAKAKERVMGHAAAMFGSVRSANGAKRYDEGGAAAPPAGGGGGLVTIRNARTGETKQVTREQARQMGAIP